MAPTQVGLGEVRRRDGSRQTGRPSGERLEMTGTHIEFDLRGVASELKDRLIAVPIYQRSFAWTGEEIQEYWEDLYTAFSEAAPEYFLGTIVLTRQEAVSRDAVIDGQQRLATTSILLAAIRDEYRERDDPERATIVQGQYLSTSDLKSASEVARLTLNSDDAYFFERRIIHGTVEPEPTRGSHELILDAHAYFRDRIRKVADDAGSQWTDRLTQWVDFLRTRLKVIVLEVPTESDAFLIFETLNDRGADPRSPRALAPQGRRHALPDVARRAAAGGHRAIQGSRR